VRPHHPVVELLTEFGEGLLDVAYRIGDKIGDFLLERTACDASTSLTGGNLMPDTPSSSPILRLNSALSKKELKRIGDTFSALVLHEEHLWLGGDEGTSIDLMTRDNTDNFGNHKRFDLSQLLQLPGGAKAEIDIEGLDVNGGYLWLVGSHSLKRNKPDDNSTYDENIARISDIAADGNRFMLGRVPISNGPDFRPVMQSGSLTAARLAGGSQGDLLTQSLKDDPHIGPFVPFLSNGKMVGIPSKDNGLDVEGLAVSGNRAFLGLRGPVLRGWAVVLELQMADSSNGLFGLEVLQEGRKYRKHFLQLEGLGVRDLAIHEKDLYILAGPTMVLDGPAFIYQWSDALDQLSDSLTWLQSLKKVVSLPFGVRKDHAEGITLIQSDPLSVLVCYDSPGTNRIVGIDGVRADIFSLGAAPVSSEQVA
jgi:hypothetical protein